VDLGKNQFALIIELSPQDIRNKGKKFSQSTTIYISVCYKGKFP